MPSASSTQKCLVSSASPVPSTQCSSTYRSDQCLVSMPSACACALCFLSDADTPLQAMYRHTGYTGYTGCTDALITGHFTWYTDTLGCNWHTDTLTHWYTDTLIHWALHWWIHWCIGCTGYTRWWIDTLIHVLMKRHENAMDTADNFLVTVGEQS
jgi:hypothetical protein